MMSRPQPKTGSKVAPVEEEASKPKSPSEHVEDLERRLAMLGTVTTPKEPVTEEVKRDDSPPAFAVPESKPAEIKGGKNALLARIMAAQEKAKTAAKKPEPEPAPPTDLLDDAPPPAFDETLLPPPKEEEAPPPPFEAIEQQVDPPPSFETIEEPPIYEEMKDTAPPAPMAPAYEDLLDHEQQNSVEHIQPMPAPTSTMEEEIMGMEGLSEEERNALIEEQRQIMAQIEQEKQANAQAIANAQADAFDQRSANAVAQVASDSGPTRAVMPPSDSAETRTVDLGGGQHVALHGQERTRAAIANGTAILVQCIHCQNWMQVTDTATLMFCPVCSVVSPVEKQNAVLTKEEAMQMTADRRMAEQLQKEEYADDEEEEEESWWDSVTSMFTFRAPSAAPAAQRQPQQLASTGRGEMGVSLPPGSIPDRGSGLVAAQTGNETETITFSNSFEEREGLLLNNDSRMPKARVAERQPLFSCVVDSVSTAASSMAGALTTTTLSEDEEGNVHGVDSSSLLAVTRAGRGVGESDQEYEPLNSNQH